MNKQEEINETHRELIEQLYKAAQRIGTMAGNVYTISAYSDSVYVSIYNQCVLSAYKKDDGAIKATIYRQSGNWERALFAAAEKVRPNPLLRFTGTEELFDPINDDDIDYSNAFEFVLDTVTAKPSELAKTCAAMIKTGWVVLHLSNTVRNGDDGGLRQTAWLGRNIPEGAFRLQEIFVSQE